MAKGLVDTFPLQRPPTQLDSRLPEPCHEQHAQVIREPQTTIFFIYILFAAHGCLRCTRNLKALVLKLEMSAWLIAGWSGFSQTPGDACENDLTRPPCFKISTSIQRGGHPYTASVIGLTSFPARNKLKLKPLLIVLPRSLNTFDRVRSHVETKDKVGVQMINSPEVWCLFCYPSGGSFICLSWRNRPLLLDSLRSDCCCTICGKTRYPETETK